MGHEPRYIAVRDELGRGVMLAIFRAAINSDDSLKGMLRKLAARIGIRPAETLLWYGHPVFTANSAVENDEIVLTALGQAIEKMRNAAGLGIGSGRWPLQHSTLPSNWSTRTWGTYRLDLRRSPEAIFRNFKSSAHKAIRRAERDQISVRQIETLDELRTYYRFAEECSQRYGKMLLGFDDFATMWKYLRPAGIFETFVAEHESKMIAGLSVWGAGGNICEIGSFQSQEAFEKKLFGPDLLKWRIIQWACERGYNSFDLGGVNPVPSDEKERNIRRFKEKWAGEYSEYLIVSA